MLYHFIGLISGGKDSIFAVKSLQSEGHELVCFANLYPNNHEEIDSYMFQSVGSEAIDHISVATGIKMYRQPIIGKPLSISMSYNSTANDEVEDLFILLHKIKKTHPFVNSVSCGAIASTYQRNRFFDVCLRLNLTPLCPLWGRDETELLSNIIESGIEAIIIKTACAGMDSSFLGQPLDTTMLQKMIKLKTRYDVHVCGEGGEYESFVLFCPGLYKKRIKIVESQRIVVSQDKLAPIQIFQIKSSSVELIV